MQIERIDVEKYYGAVVINSLRPLFFHRGRN
jgi:hypothetical protein